MVLRQPISDKMFLVEVADPRLLVEVGEEGADVFGGEVECAFGGCGEVSAGGGEVAPVYDQK